MHQFIYDVTVNPPEPYTVIYNVTYLHLTRNVTGRQVEGACILHISGTFSL